MSHRIIIGFLLLISGTALAADPSSASLAESPQLQRCLKKADELPDMAALEAEVWIKKGGGDEAHLCRAFAQANRGMHTDAAREFWALASAYEKKKPKDEDRALLMHNLAGQAFLKAKEIKNAQMQFSKSLQIAPQDETALIGMAQISMQTDKYWEALAMLNGVLKNNPQNVAALRQRGLVWMNLDNANNAKEDFIAADVLSEGKTEK